MNSIGNHQVVLVTGGAGFIGSHTAEKLLRQGRGVVVIDEFNDYYSLEQKKHNLDILYRTAAECRVYFKVYRLSCQNTEAIEQVFAKERVTSVVHLAARAGVRPSIKNPFLYIQANVTATVALLEACRNYPVQNFVYASSSSVYGKNAKVPFAEGDKTDFPVSQYAATKKTCELMAHTYSHLYGIPTTGLRFFTVYGPRGRPDMAPFMFVDRIANGIPIQKFGDGSSCRDYTYIDDIVQGVIAALDTPHQCSIFNLGNSETVSLNDFISVIESVVGRKAIIDHLPDQPGDVPLTFADLTQSRQELGYNPTTNIRVGMQQFYDWYCDFNRQSIVLPPSPPLTRDSSSDCMSNSSD